MILTIAARKGGVGKTTTAAALAQALKHKNSKNKVLLIDADGQRSASTIYGIPKDYSGFTLYDVIIGRCKASEAVIAAEAGAIIPGDARLYGLDVELSQKAGRDFFLTKALEELKDKYTHMIIDTAPGEGTGVIQAITASDGVIIPVQFNSQAFDGVAKIINTINQVKEYCNRPDLQILGILGTRYQNRTILARDYEDLITKESKKLGTKLLKTKIRQGVAIEEAQALRKDIYKYSPKSNPAQDYLQLAKELKL